MILLALPPLWSLKWVIKISAVPKPVCEFILVTHPSTLFHTLRSILPALMYMCVCTCTCIPNLWSCCICIVFWIQPIIFIINWTRICSSVHLIKGLIGSTLTAVQMLCLNVMITVVIAPYFVHKMSLPVKLNKRWYYRPPLIPQWNISKAIIWSIRLSKMVA